MTLAWVPLLGKFESTGSRLKFLGEAFERLGKDGPQKRPLFGQCLCNRSFNEGNLSATIEFEDVNEANCEFILSFDPETKAFVTAGLGFDWMYSIRRFDGSWTEHAVNGDKTNLRSKKKYNLAVSLRGSRVTLSCDGVPVLATNLPYAIGASYPGIFCGSYSEIAITDFKVDSLRAKAFVVMQYSEQFDKLYTDVIKPICSELELDVLRADETYQPGLVIADMVRQLEESKIVVADVTPINPNVYYEVGYAHALNKPTILVAEKTTPLPFDIRPFRHLFYENSIGGKKAMEDGLRKYLRAILTEGK